MAREWLPGGGEDAATVLNHNRVWVAALTNEPRPTGRVRPGSRVFGLRTDVKVAQLVEAGAPDLQVH